MNKGKPEENARKAVGRTYGALFFALFGGCWLALAAYVFEVLKLAVVIGIVAVVILFVVLAVLIQRRVKGMALELAPDEQRKRDNRVFGIINAIQWIAVFLIFSLLPRFGYANLAFAAVAFVVGAHFFFLPPSYRYQSNLVLGGAMITWAILCPFVFKGDSMVGFVAVGSGICLWTGAVWALRTATALSSSDPLH